MNWLESLNDALRYLEEHLEGEMDLDHMARLACCSPYHFQRMFSYMAGTPLSEYIRRRRMTRAAFDLQNSDEKVIDIALRYGYDSPTAFNRAFHGVHGVAPSAARKQGVNLKAYHPISFKITIRGEAEMNYRIEKKEAFRIVGPKLETSWTPENKEGFQDCPRFWAEHDRKGTIPQLLALMDGEPKGMLGVSVGYPYKDSRFNYYIAVSSTQPTPEGMSEFQVDAHTWAIFECKGPMPTALQTMMGRIMTEWFPSSGYQYVDGPDIELYGEGDQTSADYVCWIWVPVQKA